jgi:SPP1 family predicted phage head-tail adaptor
VRGRGAVAVIEYQPTPQNDFDGTGGDWVTFSNCYADVRPLRGRELIDAQQVQSHITHNIETEFVYGAHSGMRIKVRRQVLVTEDEPEHDDNYRFFEITSLVNVNEGNRSMELLCIEKV